MSLVALLLTLGSALLHALRDFLIKGSSDKLVFSWLFRLVGLVLLLPAVLARGVLTVSPIGWILILATSFVHVLYTISLAHAYETGDLSLVYPIARSAPLFVLLWSTLVWREPMSGLGITGVLLIVIGAYVVQTRGLSWKKLAAPIRLALHDRSIRLAWLTALLVAAYSLIDDRGVAIVDPLLFLFSYAFLSCLLLTPIVVATRRGGILRELRSGVGLVLLAAAMSTVGYLLALYALRMEHVGYVAGVRQVSILFGVLLGWRVFREPYGPSRLAGAGLIVAGMVTIGFLA
jgi:drug/metabolite transporter (DMT)-like permease